MLIDGEHEVYRDEPDKIRSLQDQIPLLIAAALCPVVFFGLRSSFPSSPIPWAVLAMSFVFIGSAVLEWARRQYTQYLLTNMRVIRFDGMLRREAAWVSWGKITDVTVSQNIVDRLWGTATIKIHSAGAESFKELHDLADWRGFVDEVAANMREFR